MFSCELARVFVLRARLLTVDAIEEVSVVAFDSRVRFRMKICDGQTARPANPHPYSFDIPGRKQPDPDTRSRPT